MKSWEKLIHKDPSVVAEGLDEIVEDLKNRPKKAFARVANDYYQAEHDILKSRIFYLDDNGELKEDMFAANVKIPHAFFMEQVDQKTQYLLSRGVKFVTENDALETALDEYLDEDFNLFLDEVVEGAAINGAEYAYARTTGDDKIKFQVSEFISTDTILDDYHNEVAVVRRYVKHGFSDDKEIEIVHAEVYRAEDVVFLVREDGKKFGPDPNKKLNPQGHVIAYNKEDDALLERSYGRIPFYRLSNNRHETSDLVPVKDLIDDFDRMASFLSNNLEDYDKPIYVITGYQGQDISQLRQNIKARGVVKTGAPNQQGGFKLETFQIPYEARKAKMEIDKEMIYKFGMAFDSSQTGDGNITNVVIRSRYSLLDLKCNKIEPRLRSLIRWCLELILEDINRRGLGDFKMEDIKVEIERNTIFNENDIAQRELTEAQATKTLIEGLFMMSDYVDDESIIRKICEFYELDFEEVKAKLEKEEYTPFEGEVDEADEVATGDN